MRRGAVRIVVLACLALVWSVLPATTTHAVTPPASTASLVVTYPVAGGHASTLTPAATVTVADNGYWTSVDVGLGGTAAIHLASPYAHRFTSGTTDAGAWTYDHPISMFMMPPDHAIVGFHDLGALCPHVAPTGTVQVTTATYSAAGVLTAFAAHVSATCPSTGVQLELDISHGLAAATAAALAPTGWIAGTAGPLTDPVAAESGTAHVTLRTGGTPITLGTLALAGVPAGWSASASAPTCPTPVPAWSGCAVDVAWASDGTPAAFDLTVGTTGGPTASVTARLSTPRAVPAPVLTASPRFDGVSLSWTEPATAPFAETWTVWLRRSGADWVQGPTVSAPRYSDVDAGTATDTDYYVVAHAGATTPASDGTSATATAKRAPGGAPPRGTWCSPPNPLYVCRAAVSELRMMGATDVRTFIPTAPDSLDAMFAGRIPDGPGTYAVPGDLPVDLVMANCERPTGTLTVRDLVTSLYYGSIYRFDATFSGTCHSGDPVRLEERFGTDLAPFTAVYARPPLGGEAGLSGILLGHLAQTDMVIANAGTAPADLGSPTVTAPASPSQTFGVANGCGATLGAGASCTVTVTATPTAAVRDTAELRMPGVGIAGDDVVGIGIWFIADSTPPLLVTAPTARWAPVEAQYTPYFLYTDPQDVVASTDTRVRTAALGATSFTTYTYPAIYQHLDTAQGGGLPYGKQGTEHCVSTRARNIVGFGTPWSAERCIARLVNDRAFTSASGFVRLSGATTRYSGGSVLRATRSGAKAYGAPVSGRRFALEVTTCASCGTVAVYVGTTRIGTLSTYSATTRYRRVFELPLRSTPISGRLSVVVTSSGKQVLLDGFGSRLT